MEGDGVTIRDQIQSKNQYMMRKMILDVEEKM